MKKIPKIVLASVFALSTLVAPLIATKEVSAANHTAICEADPKCFGVTNFGMRVNNEAIGGYTKLVIKSGHSVVSIRPYNKIRALKSGQAVVYAYDSSDNYIYYNITVQ